MLRLVPHLCLNRRLPLRTRAPVLLINDSASSPPSLILFVADHTLITLTRLHVVISPPSISHHRRHAHNIHVPSQCRRTATQICVYTVLLLALIGFFSLSLFFPIPRCLWPRYRSFPLLFFSLLSIPYHIITNTSLPTQPHYPTSLPSSS